uniref:Putative tick transposon n=1 Tax=Rhipicephalus pulchellus TaxID=72859 RepID=L7LU83_RHIPC
MWLTGDIMGVSVAVCVLYMAVSGSRLEANEALIDCVCQDSKCVTSDREVLILGDFNGHISELDGYTDANGSLLMQLAERLQLDIANLDPRCEGKYTWCARGSATSIDYVLVSHNLTRLLNSLDIDEEGDYSIGSDHNRIRIDFSRTQYLKPRHRMRSEGQLHLPAKAIEVVAAEFEDSKRRREAETYEEYVDILRNIMRRHMSRNKNPARHTRKLWWDKEVSQAWQARREANRAHRRAVKAKDPEVCSNKWQHYLKLKHEMQALVQMKLANANRQMLQDLRDEGKSTAAKFWNYVRSLDRKEQPELQIMDSETGQPVADLRGYATTYLKSLYGPANTNDSPTLSRTLIVPTIPHISETKWAFTHRSVERALSRLRTHTATGPDDIPARLIKCLGSDCKDQLAGFFTNILDGAEIPREWRLGRVVLIPKKGGNTSHLSDYRPLTVTCTLYRAFTQVIKDWVYGWAESRGLLTELQNGFRKGRRLEDNLFVITQCAEIARKENRGLLCCFLDVEKAYDNVPHASLFNCLRDLGLPKTLLSTIKQLYSGNTVTASFAGVTTESVEVCKGLRQGCPLSPILYLLYVSELERAIERSSLGFSLKFSTTGIDENRKIPGLAFADDIVLMTENPRDMQALLNICAAEIEKLGLRYNAKKTTVVPDTVWKGAGGCLIVQVPRSDTACRR